MKKQLIKSQSGTITTDILKAILMICVIVGHSLLSSLPSMSLNERIIFTFFGKVLSPCVFIFFFLAGYSQGLRRNRYTKKVTLSRVKSLLIPYFVWASIAWLFYFFLGGTFTQTHNLWDYIKDLPFYLNYIISIATFTGSWQYYFLIILIVSLFILQLFKKKDLLKLKFWKNFAFIVQFSIMMVISIVFWFWDNEKISSSIFGAVTYMNLFAWLYPILWGYYIAASKEKLPWEEVTISDFIIYFVLFFFCSLEMVLLGLKMNSYMIIDQFSALTMLLAIYSVKVFGFLSMKLEKFLIERKRKITLRFLLLYGRFSIIVFLIHLPYQWFFLQGLQIIFNNKISASIGFIIMSFFSLFFCYWIIILVKNLPKKLRKLFLGV